MLRLSNTFLKNKSAVTLIELVITIAVISIILTIVTLVLNLTATQTEYSSDSVLLNKYAKELSNELENGLYFLDDRNYGIKKAATIISGAAEELVFLTFISKTVLNPDTVYLDYKIKDSVDGSNRKNLFVLYVDENNIERLISENTYYIYSMDTSIIIFDTALTDIPYSIYYLPETTALLNNQIRYYYNIAEKTVYREDKYGLEKLPFTNVITDKDVKVEPSETGLFTYYLNDGSETGIIGAATADSVSMIKAEYNVFNQKKAIDKIKTVRSIYLEFKRN